jgi:DNA-directed RNA polymerase subunit RPC12/RpoP
LTLGIALMSMAGMAARGQVANTWQLRTLLADLTFVPSSLRVTDLKGQAATSASPGARRQLRALAQNIGLGKSDRAVVRVFDGNTPLDEEVEIPSLLPGGDHEIAIPWTVTVGRHEFRLVIDPDQKLKDTNTHNNVGVITVDVPKPAFPWWIVAVVAVAAVVAGLLATLSMYRRMTRPAVAPPVEEEPATRPVVRCPHCGALTSAAGRTCVSCGRTLPPSGSLPAAPASPAPAPGVHCPDCDRDVQPEDGFCPRCGRWLG